MYTVTTRLLVLSCIQHTAPEATMEYYNTVPSGPSSRPYNPNAFAGPSGTSGTGSSLSPNFPSYPLMTDMPYDNRPQPSASISGVQPPIEAEDDENEHDHEHEHEHELEHELGQEHEGASTTIEVDDSGPLVEPHQDLDSFLESFWTRQMAVVERDNPDFKTYPLPLARIKKVMKSDEEVKVSLHAFLSRVRPSAHPRPSYHCVPCVSLHCSGPHFSTCTQCNDDADWHLDDFG